MTFKEAIQTCLRNYVTFSGRATRPEYWWFFLFCFLGGLIASALESLINGITNTADGPTLLSAAFNLATFLPMLAVGFRRMHDTGRSGLYLFYPLIAFMGLVTFVGMFGPEDAFSGELMNNVEGIFGTIVILALIVIAISPLVVIWWLTRPSEPGENKYGPNPNEVPQ